MYVCICKAITESELAQRTRSCLLAGAYCPADIIEALNLLEEGACGFCSENPEHIFAIVENELAAWRGETPGRSRTAPPV